MFDDAWQSLLQGDLLMFIIQAFFSVVSVILTVILLPFSLLIETFFPEVNLGLEALTEIFVYADTYMAWLLDALLIPKAAIVILSSYYIATFSISLASWGTKLLLAWKKHLLS